MQKDSSIYIYYVRIVSEIVWFSSGLEKHYHHNHDSKYLYEYSPYDIYASDNTRSTSHISNYLIFFQSYEMGIMSFVILWIKSELRKKEVAVSRILSYYGFCLCFNQSSHLNHFPKKLLNSNVKWCTLLINQSKCCI